MYEPAGIAVFMLHFQMLYLVLCGALDGCSFIHNIFNSKYVFKYKMQNLKTECPQWLRWMISSLNVYYKKALLNKWHNMICSTQQCIKRKKKKKKRCVFHLEESRQLILLQHILKVKIMTFLYH